MMRTLTPAVLAFAAISCQAAGTEVTEVRAAAPETQKTEPEKKAEEKVETKEAAPSAAGSVELGAAPSRVRVAPKSGRPLAEHVRATRSGRRWFVVLRGVQAEVPPATVYHLYLDLPAGETPAEEDPRYIGSLNFYDSYSGGDPEKFRSFEITGVARSLHARGLLQDETTITIRPGGPPGEGAKARISSIELIEE